ncbi:quinon protein alcohol dehydrogenase-like superfamily [Schizophyllum amplum]|uniref:Quinon protein alcohol dehydrogenase-like superfamily n=1 Tax=Schizophyllum amplum TaxID=97359 RepID=A0A550CMP9_9AGAR|nr:quinon protein alcohol dehydrogenase-like superfamily [Auriculariopsis ampla]
MAASSSRQPHQTPPTEKSRKSKGKPKQDALPVPEAHAKDATVEADSGETTTWDWMRLTDSSACNVPPVFTRDGSYFFSLVGSSVKIHSAATGVVVSTLSNPRPAGKESLADTLTCATLNPHNVFQLIVGSLNGCLLVWDYLDAVLLQTIDLAQPIRHVCAHQKFKDVVFVAVSKPSKKQGRGDDNAAVLRVSLKPSEATADASLQTASAITPIGKTRYPTGLAFSASGDWLVATAGHKAYIVNSSSLEDGFTKYVSPEKLTCLATHPVDDYFATGDVKGNILEKKSDTTSLHWHAHAVASLTFTLNGAYLLSGGEEAVLVAWQLRTGRKEFVLVFLSNPVNGEPEYLLGLADATYTFVNADSLKASRSYSRIKLDPAVTISTPLQGSTPLAVHNQTATLILPSSHPSSLQVYSPSASQLVSELEVSPSNRVSRRDDVPLEPARVERAEISPSGDWMATIDNRAGDDTFRGESSSWTLNTRIDRPHGQHGVTDLRFSPVPSSTQSLQLVTTGDDGFIKLWRISTVKSKDGPKEDYWLLRSSFGFRTEKPSKSSWSPDGSLLAIATSSSVAIYDPTTTQLRQTLTAPECKSPTDACFLGTAGRYLAVAGGKDVVLWDLLFQTVRWHHRCSSAVEHIVAHPQNDSFAAFHKGSEAGSTAIAVFSPSSPRPALRSVPLMLKSVVWHGESSSTTGFSFVGISDKWDVVFIGDDIKHQEDIGAHAQSITTEGTPHRRTLFQEIFGEAALPSSSLSSARPAPAEPATDSLFEEPAYLMPPMEDMFDTIMGSFVHAREEDGPNGEGAQQEDDDVEMEEAPPISPPPPALLPDNSMIASFIELFSKQSIKPRPIQSAPPPPQTNGHAKHKPNALPAIKSNGQVATAPAKAPRRTTVTSSPALPPPTPPESPAVNGNTKKRKKASS